MKKLLLRSIMAIAVAFSVYFPASATTHTVTVSDFQFTPATLTVQVGDTIKWVWASGVHTTTSNSIPTGAAPWDSPISSSNTSFMYVPTVAGQYDYVCTPHAPAMAGQFIVTVSTSVKNIVQDQLFTIAPNPATTEIRIRSAAQIQDVTLIDITGRHIPLQEISAAGAEKAYSVSEIATGVYWMYLRAGEAVEVKRILIAR